MNEQNTAPVKIFSAAGRMGRLRYIAYNLLATVVFFVIYIVAAMIFGAMAGAMGVAGSPEGAMFGGGLIFVIFLVLFILALVLKFMWAVQRSHDMNTSGWLSLILLVPLAEFVFWFAPGTDGENQYGPPPPPNSAGVVVAIVLPFVLFFIFGILAAIAIPAYQGYIRAAQEAAELERQGGIEEGSPWAPQSAPRQFEPAPGGSGSSGNQ
ncbi:MAG TPA: DUF805 domain-containing protein [Gammaproteobacteria bacterium]|nr:DUF805 domain-containing protein [Gammaproteobacteria bacterium]